MTEFAKTTALELNAHIKRLSFRKPAARSVELVFEPKYRNEAPTSIVLYADEDYIRHLIQILPPYRSEEEIKAEEEALRNLPLPDERVPPIASASGGSDGTD